MAAHNPFVTDQKIVRIGIIGAGFARTTQIPGFKACDGARIVAIASARREHAEEVAREFGHRTRRKRLAGAGRA